MPNKASAVLMGGGGGGGVFRRGLGSVLVSIAGKTHMKQLGDAKSVFDAGALN